MEPRVGDVNVSAAELPIEALFNGCKEIIKSPHEVPLTRKHYVGLMNKSRTGIHAAFNAMNTTIGTVIPSPE